MSSLVSLEGYCGGSPNSFVILWIVANVQIPWNSIIMKVPLTNSPELWKPKRKQSKQPIRRDKNYHNGSIEISEGKHANCLKRGRSSVTKSRLFLFLNWLVVKMLRGFWTKDTAKCCKTKSNTLSFQLIILKYPVILSHRCCTTVSVEIYITPFIQSNTRLLSTLDWKFS